MRQPNNARLNVRLRQARWHELNDLYQLMAGRTKWQAFNAPYENRELPSLKEYEMYRFQHLLSGDIARLIEVNGEVVGTVSRYMKNGCLELGIIIHNDDHWGKGIGAIAMEQWVNRQFTRSDLERVWLTTWSGNRAMIKCAKRLGFEIVYLDTRRILYKNDYINEYHYYLSRENWKRSKR